jgi:hypothetical protein
MIYSLRMRTGSIDVLSVDDDEDQCIRLLSFCKKHRQPSHDHSVAYEHVRLLVNVQTMNHHPIHLVVPEVV